VVADGNAMTFHRASRFGRIAAPALMVSVVLTGCSRLAPAAGGKTFDTPESAVLALNEATTRGDLPTLLAIFGPEAKEIVDTSDADTGQRNRQVFAVAMSEGWHLEDHGKAKVLVVGNEAWPFPVPLVQDGGRWRFDTADGKEEVLARRIGRNELAAIRICKTYVAAQRMYARDGHDGLPAGVYAMSIRSSSGKQNGLYWPARPGALRSPLGELAQEAEDRAAAGGPVTPFHGYYFRILSSQGAAAAGGARDYTINGRMTDGFALVAWPAFYDASGIMTFLVNQDRVVYQKDLGPDTAKAVADLHVYNPDSSWTAVH